MKHVIGLGCLVVLLCTGCATATKQEPTSLQIQSYQTKEFDAEKGTVFASVMSVFQDLGYIIQSADKETGFITATSATTNKTGFWDAMGGMQTSGQTKATAFVEELRPGLVSVRINFVDTANRSTAYGQSSQEDTPILDPKAYQVAFDKIENAVFIRIGNRGTTPQPVSTTQPASN
ncbi:MAG: hypothetical protein EXR82_09395 [Gammaproteobacteria bacterium]|nr:hypothetical protein [Gammaproteobacteria bacterium]